MRQTNEIVLFNELFCVYFMKLDFFGNSLGKILHTSKQSLSH